MLRKCLLVLLFGLSPIAAFAFDTVPAGAERPCGAIDIAEAYGEVIDTEDPKAAGERYADVQTWNARCDTQLLPADKQRMERVARDAKDSLTWPRTLSQAVDEIVKGSPQNEMDIVANSRRGDLAEFNSDWGMGIRNGYGLWRGNLALLRSACGGPLCHPEEASMKIIEAVWERLQERSRKKSK